MCEKKNGLEGQGWLEIIPMNFQFSISKQKSWTALVGTGAAD